MSQRKDTFVNLLMNLSGINSLEAKTEFDLSCEEYFTMHLWLINLKR